MKRKGYLEVLVSVQAELAATMEKVDALKREVKTNMDTLEIRKVQIANLQEKLRATKTPDERVEELKKLRTADLESHKECKRKLKEQIQKVEQDIKELKEGEIPKSWVAHARDINSTLKTVTAERDALTQELERVRTVAIEGARELRSGFDKIAIELEAKYSETIDMLEATQMTEEKAREVLGDWITRDGKLHSVYHPDFDYVSFPAAVGPMYVAIEGHLTSEQLKAIAFWMENKGEK